MTISRFASLGFFFLLFVAATAASAAPGPGGCGVGSWIGGTVEICDGVHVYRDYVFDDYGSNVGDPNAPSTGVLSRPDGKTHYDGVDINSADLVDLRLWIEGGLLHVRFELNALFNPDSTFAALALDTDDDALTGGGVWADLCAVEQPHGSGTCSVPLSSTGWEELYLFETGDPSTNLIEGTMPIPATGTWRVQAVTGIKGRRVVMNVAYRGGIEGTGAPSTTTGLWFDYQQSTTLSTGDISQFGAVVEKSKLLGGVTEKAPAVTGFQHRVYVSDFTIAYDAGAGEFVYDQNAEGMDYAGLPPGAGSFGQAFHFYGKYQPYGIYIPTTQSQPHGLQLALHGLGANYSSLINKPGMQATLGEGENRIIIVPLGRGPAGWYNEISEKDVLDVIADVRANYVIDPEKIFAGGYSMGGYGSYRFATLYPDLFAGYIVWVGALSGGGAKSISATDFLGNLRQVPGAMLYLGEDELVNVSSYLAVQSATEALGYEHILYFHPGGEHFTLSTADDWAKEAAWSSGRTRQKQPKQITYRTEPFVWNEDLGVIHDRAYWVRDIRGRDTGNGDYVDIDILTQGCGGSLPLTTRTTPDPAGPDPVAWTAQEFLTTGQDPLAQDDFITATLVNVDSLVVEIGDQGGACLSGDTIDYEITTDGPSQLTFSDGTVIDMPVADTYTGTLPEPGSLASLVCGALLVGGLCRRSRARN